MSHAERNELYRSRALQNGAKRYSIMLGPEYAGIVEQQAKIWGSNNEVFRQALLALETTTSGNYSPEAGHTLTISRDQTWTVEPVGSDTVRMTFTRGAGDQTAD